MNDLISYTFKDILSELICANVHKTVGDEKKQLEKKQKEKFSKQKEGLTNETERKPTEYDDDNFMFAKFTVYV